MAHQVVFMGSSSPTAKVSGLVSPAARGLKYTSEEAGGDAETRDESTPQLYWEAPRLIRRDGLSSEIPKRTGGLAPLDRNVCGGGK